MDSLVVLVNRVREDSPVNPERMDNPENRVYLDLQVLYFLLPVCKNS